MRYPDELRRGELGWNVHSQAGVFERGLALSDQCLSFGSLDNTLDIRTPASLRFVFFFFPQCCFSLTDILIPVSPLTCTSGISPPDTDPSSLKRLLIRYATSCFISTLAWRWSLLLCRVLAVQAGLPVH